MASRTVTLAFPSDETTLTVSLDGSVVQEALAVINNVLVSNGFVRDAIPLEAGVQGFVTSYSRRDPRGLVRLGDHPLVWFRDGRIEVAFSEGRHSGQISSATAATAKLVETALSARYGKQRVKVTHGPA